MSDKLPYRGFEISPAHNIYFNHKQVFTAYWQRCFNLDECKQLIDTSVDTKLEQLRRIDIGRSFDILKSNTDLHDESQEIEAQEWNDRIELHETLKLLDNE